MPGAESYRPANFQELLPLLHRAGVEFIVIGGGAGIAHGQARVTYDVDVVYSRSAENMQRIIDALRDYAPYRAARPADCRSNGTRRCCERA